MSGREFLELDTPQRSLYLEKCKRVELIQKMLDKLPKADQNLCNYGSYFLAVNASLCGLVTNHFFRNILHVRRAAFMSALPMAVVPFISTAVIYDIFVREALFVGELNCEVCAVVRGGLIGAVVGGLYPMFLALPLNASLAASVFRKMSLGVLLQALTGLYLATKHHGIYVKILQQMNASRDPEELQA
ncbi:PREDICTED: transmembrane protein 126A [Eurypyga helias]|uniref:transmembrane protein 126A n=1 Tax=Eurypyga helias TaxID=54383 RepID=UPI000528DC03|nr:PREDICTED: transmembrane protein 126A [Eurypyga helias]